MHYYSSPRAYTPFNSNSNVIHQNLDTPRMGNKGQISFSEQRNQTKGLFSYKGKRETNIYIDHINGYTEHVHCLLSLDANQNIATIANLLKGESSFWINKNKLTEAKFAWQSEYFAASVSHSQINIMRQYIRNQEDHHEKKSFHDEYNEFINKYGFEKC